MFSCQDGAVSDTNPHPAAARQRYIRATTYGTVGCPSNAQKRLFFQKATYFWANVSDIHSATFVKKDSYLATPKKDKQICQRLVCVVEFYMKSTTRTTYDKKLVYVDSLVSASKIPSTLRTQTQHKQITMSRQPFFLFPCVHVDHDGGVGATTPIRDISISLHLDYWSQSHSEAFCVAGVASKSLYGTAEALWRPHLSNEDLAQVCGKAFLSALERDCLSGYGATVYLITRDGIMEYDLACRND
jgi:Proteasome subunit